LDTLRVELAERGYNIHIGQGILKDVGAYIKPIVLSEKVSIVTNPSIWDIYSNILETSLLAEGFDIDLILIPPGENHKNLKTVSDIYDRLLKRRMDRTASLIAFGGGIVGDVGGFAAATYLRGINCFQIPTTLLAQVDSSVGGKTGVNHPMGKNMIGAFYQPRAVIADTATLKTLPRREFLAGVAEIIKYGVIADSGFFAYLEKNIEGLINGDSNILSYSIRRSCELKADVVAKDERESGLRAILNFGHTFGHAVEAATGYEEYLHGEGVAIGMVLAARLSAKMGLCREDEANRVIALIEKSGLPVSAEGVKIEEIMEAMKVDKKAAAGKVRFVLMNSIGSVSLKSDIPEGKIAEAVSGK